MTYSEIKELMLTINDLPRKEQAIIIMDRIDPEKRSLAFKILDNPQDADKLVASTEIKMSKTHYPFPSIEQFVHVKRNVQFKSQYRGLDEQNEPIMDRTAKLPKLVFEGTTKLHGTNAGIVISPVDFYCQSRERIITPDSDNAGFATFIHSLDETALQTVRRNYEAGKTIVLYGEWAGGNIQKIVALNKLPKTFYPFAAKFINEEGETEEWLDIRNWVFPEQFKSVYTFETFQIEIDFEEPEYAVQQINDWVIKVEKQCPVGFQQGADGVGEGIVFKALDPNYNSSRYWMKCKGTEHANSKVKKMVTVDIEKFENDKKFVENVLDEERLQQGYQWLIDNTEGPVDEKKTGDFIRWIFNDVLKEKKLEMEASGIQEKDLGKLLSNPAKKWYFAKINS